MTAVRSLLTLRRIACLGDAIAYFAPGLGAMRREALRVAHLDRERQVLGIRLHYSDHCETVDFPLRTIIADALALGTAALLIAHNHPSGDPSPSRADLVATRALVDLARPLGIRLHDHLIFAGDDCRSMRTMGLL